jgi:hypothetical protein
LFYLQRKRYCELFITGTFSREGVVSTSPNPQAGGTPLFGCPRLLIQFIHSYPPFRRPFLHPRPEDAPCRGDRDPHSWKPRISLFLKIDTYLSSFPPTHTPIDKPDVTCDRQMVRHTLLSADKHSDLPSTQLTLTVSNRCPYVLTCLGAAKLGDSRNLHVN